MKLKHYFIASLENQYRPWILGKTAMACFCIGIWGLRLFLPQAISFAQPSIDPAVLMAKVNEERTQRYLPAFATDSRLSAAAQIKSQDMLDRGYFSHEDPDGKFVWGIIEAQGYAPFQILGENLAMDFVSAEAVVAAWMNSPDHRANILNEKFEDQGMASVYGAYTQGRSTIMVTNLFGSIHRQPAEPLLAALQTPVEQPTDQQPESPQPVAAATETDQTPPAAPPASNVGPGSSQEQPYLYTVLKILFGLAAAAYTFFLVLDSILIYRAKVRRESVPSSPHSLLLILVSMVNFLTLWI